MSTQDVLLHSLKLIGKAHAKSTKSGNYLQFVKLTEQAPTPTRESPRSAAFK